MKATDIRNKSIADLEKELNLMRKLFREDKFTAASGQLQNSAAMKGKKKAIARILTIVREKVKEEAIAKLKSNN
jgi:large subunit ribosomal protein L29